MMVAELRKHPRVSTDLEIMYHTKDIAKEGTTSTHHFGTVIDLSKDGAGLIVEQPHNPNEQIWLEGVTGTNKPINCTIKWIRENSGQFKLGVQFTNI